MTDLEKAKMTLSNDENSTDSELIVYLMVEFNLTKKVAKSLVAKRIEFLNNF